jgi:hypothetical protein
MYFVSPVLPKPSHANEPSSIDAALWPRRGPGPREATTPLARAGRAAFSSYARVSQNPASGRPQSRPARRDRRTSRPRERPARWDRPTARAPGPPPPLGRGFQTSQTNKPPRNQTNKPPRNQSIKPQLRPSSEPDHRRSRGAELLGGAQARPQGRVSCPARASMSRARGHDVRLRPRTARAPGSGAWRCPTGRGTRSRCRRDALRAPRRTRRRGS